MADPFDLDEAVEALTGRTFADHGRQQREIGGALRAFGLSARPPQAGGIPLAASGSDLLVPQGSRPVPLDYVGTYMTLSEYAGTESLGLPAARLAESVIILFTTQAPRDRLVELLITLYRGLAYPELVDAFLAEHRQGLMPDVAARFDNKLKTERTVPAAPQTVLAALRHVLAMQPVPLTAQARPENLVLLFVHAIAEGLAAAASGDEERLAGQPISLAMEMVCNTIFNDNDDTYSAIARHLRLWRDYADEGAPYIGGRSPADLAREATGLDVEDFLALGFAVLSTTIEWRPGRPLHIPYGYFPSVEPAVLERFVDVVAVTPDQMGAALQNLRSRWDFLEFQRHPVLSMTDGLLVIDAGLMFERVTSGLYWDVHDYLKANEGENSRNAWTKAWGAIVEAMIEEELTALAPPLLDCSRTVWDEDDLERAYGQNSKRADQVIDVGKALVVTDVVSGQVSVPTRIDGDLTAFRKDLKRLVFDKAQQVHETAMNLVGDESKLTGVKADPPRRVYPVIAVGSSFARNPIIANLVDEHITQAKLLEHADARIRPLSVVDTGEVEILEGLASNLGCAVTDLLDAWHNSGIANMSLRNYLIARYPDNREAFRALRLRERVDAAVEEMISRLGLRP